jgi:hypothetical protein
MSKDNGSLTTEEDIADKDSSISDNTIGRTIGSETFQITMDEFWFSIGQTTILGPFDFICVDNIHNTRTIGIVKEL